MNKILKNPFYEDNLDSYSDGYWLIFMIYQTNG